MYIRASLFFCFIAFAIKILAINYTDFDLFGDEAQYWIWSKNLDLGYYSKPPLLAWFLGFFTLILGNSFVSLKLFPIFFYLINSYIVFLISFKLFRNLNLAALSSITFYLLPAVTVSSFFISTDIILILFWSLSLLFLLKIREDNSLQNFIFLGIFLGLAFLAKYAAIYFFLSLLVIIIFDTKLKIAFLKNYKYSLFFLVTTLVVFLPNIVWNINNGWVTINHISENAGLNRASINLINSVEFALSQILMMGPFVVLIVFFSIKKFKLTFETKFLLSFSLPILFIVIIESLLVRSNANWAAVALVSLLILFTNHLFENFRKMLIFNTLANLVFCVLFYFMIAITSPFAFFDRIGGVSEFSKELENKYLQEKDYLVVEDRLIFSSISYLFRKKETKIFTTLWPGKKITHHFQINSPLSPSFKKNFIFIGNPVELKYLKNSYKIKNVGTLTARFKKTPIIIYEVIF